MPKKVLIALPPAMLENVDYIASAEHRTRSDLIREALRRYIQTFNQTHTPSPTTNVLHFEPTAPTTTVQPSAEPVLAAR